MATLRYSELSRADLAAAWDFIAIDSPRIATLVLDRIYKKIERLRSQPLAGHRRDDIRRGARCLNCDGYLIIHRYSAGIVRIERIVHHSRHQSNIPFDEQP